MPVRPTPRLMTADELLHLPKDTPNGDRLYELHAGRLVVREPPGGQHGQVQMQLGSLLTAYVRQHRLGIVFSETGVWLSRDPDTVKGPDLSFVRHGRLPGGVVPPGYLELPPDLAVEIRSPNDRKGKEQARVRALLAGGVRLVWHVEPPKRRATLHAPGADPELLGEDGFLDGRDVVPGFRCRLREALDW